MNDFHYHQKAVDLDRRLEKVINTELESQKSATSQDEAPLGLQAFLERNTISEEIAATRMKGAALEETLDINVVRAREKVASIVEERASRFDAFSEAAKPMVDEITKSAAEQEALDARREELSKSAGTLKDIGRTITSHPHFEAGASGAIVGAGVAGAGAVAKKIKKTIDER